MAMIKKTIAYVFIIGGVFMLSCLSLWQVERLAWKENLIKEIETGLSNPAITITPGNDLTGVKPYQKITITGEFLYGYERYLQPRVRNSKRGDKQQGVEHLVPFLLEGGQHIFFINRGWFPKPIMADADSMDKIPRPLGQKTITAIINPLPRTHAFTPDNSLSQMFIYWADVNGLARVFEMNERVYPFLLKEINSTDSLDQVYLPQKFEAEITLPNNHKKYVFFWGAMAIIWAGFGIMFFVKSRKKDRA